MYWAIREKRYHVYINTYSENCQEVDFMRYKFLVKNNSYGEWVERDFSDRFEVTHWVYDNITSLSSFAVPESGNIFGYAVELSEKDKPQAILHFHEIAQMIWIDLV